MTYQHINPTDLFADRAMPIGVTSIRLEKNGEYVVGIKVSDNMGREHSVDLKDPIDQTGYHGLRNIVEAQIKTMMEMGSNESYYMDRTGSVNRGKKTKLNSYGFAESGEKATNPATGEVLKKSGSPSSEHLASASHGGEGAAEFLQQHYSPTDEEPSKAESYSGKSPAKKAKESKKVKQLPLEENDYDTILGKYGLDFGPVPTSYAEA